MAHTPFALYSCIQSCRTIGIIDEEKEHVTKICVLKCICIPYIQYIKPAILFAGKNSKVENYRGVVWSATMMEVRTQNRGWIFSAKCQRRESLLIYTCSYNHQIISASSTISYILIIYLQVC